MGVLQTHRELLDRLLPDDPPDDFAVREGQFHHVVLGSDRVVCLPRTAAAAVRLPGRAAVLRALAQLDLGFRTPEPLAEGCAPDTAEPPFLVLSRIPGAPLDSDDLRHPAAAESVAAQYAALLTALAAAGADERVRAALPHARRDQWREFAASVRAELFPLMSYDGRRRAERELAALDGLPHLTAAVVHGDLGAENVLWEVVAGRPRLSGVVDWDEAALGDPAEDLAAIGAGHGEDMLRRVLALGGWSDGGTTGRISAIRGTFALQQALYAVRDGDEDELADGLTGYR
ncbi:viomycin phosphotransferase [Streptomyces sp. NBS 14/10]|uniref:viomycin phosphotransferase n=1 Tax=Streptomyces sp. NBS 14/10 TaxID=1945643 RepID=UPI000B7D6173|nr:viomycin phosphotransferase [Streptomyces sp. NBS 14/10]KAK1181499.1 viomycin phosphotransferase [Streptomyces sp. NBS 14/10]